MKAEGCLRLEWDFSPLSEDEIAVAALMCRHFSLWMQLRDPQEAVTSTSRFKQFRNAVILWGGVCTCGAP